MIILETPKELLLDFLEANTIKVPDGCWLYNGVISRQGQGYGVVCIEDKIILAHRLSAHIHWDFDLNSSRMILHRLWCINRNCWNPEHIYEGTARQNALDSVICKTHVQARKTHCPKGHEYTKENTYITNKEKRVCKMCQKEKDRIKYINRKNNDNSKPQV